MKEIIAAQKYNANYSKASGSAPMANGRESGRYGILFRLGEFIFWIRWI